MRLDKVEREQLLVPGADRPGGNGSRSQSPARRAGSWALKAVALVALVAAGVWAYRANVTTGPAVDMNMRVSTGDTPFPVAIARAERGAMTGTVVYTGSVAAFNEEDIFPRVTGRIVEMLVYPGDAVRAGQVVARLDDIELSSRVLEAEAGAASAQANRAQMEADVIASEHGVVQAEKELAMVEAELAYARSVATRSEQLVGVGAISRQEYENDRAMALSQAAKREAARAKVDQSRAMETSARKKVEAADSMVAQGRAALRTATVVRDYVTIVAPSSGYVVKRLVAPGVLVQPGMPILKIAQVDRVRLQANVGEKDIAAIRVGSPVVVTTTAGQSVTARVTSVFPFVDQGSRTAVVEAIVDNRDRRLLPGQYVTMQLVTGERANAITVPRGAVGRLGGAAKVWVVSDGRAEPRDVTTGLEGADRIEIVRGLTGTEQVVARGHENLYAGARVADAAATVPAAAGNVPVPPSKPDETRSTPRKEGGHAGH
jgi:multidrug efflux pump subunit AcrA (membrane-fusion protein)